MRIHETGRDGVRRDITEDVIARFGKAVRRIEGGDILAKRDLVGDSDSIGAIRKAHLEGATELPRDFLHKYPSNLKDETALAIRKAHQAAGKVRVDSRMIARIIRDGKMRKRMSVPPESSNAANGGQIANTGASNDFHDQPEPQDRARLLGPAFSASFRSPSALNLDAAAAAIRKDLSRQRKDFP